jgi:CHAT domain-containing protein
LINFGKYKNIGISNFYNANSTTELDLKSNWLKIICITFSILGVAYLSSMKSKIDVSNRIFSSNQHFKGNTNSIDSMLQMELDQKLSQTKDDNKKSLQLIDAYLNDRKQSGAMHSYLLLKKSELLYKLNFINAAYATMFYAMSYNQKNANNQNEQGFLYNLIILMLQEGNPSLSYFLLKCYDLCAKTGAPYCSELSLLKNLQVDNRSISSLDCKTYDDIFKEYSSRINTNAGFNSIDAKEAIYWYSQRSNEAEYDECGENFFQQIYMIDAYSELMDYENIERIINRVDKKCNFKDNVVKNYLFNHAKYIFHFNRYKVQRNTEDLKQSFKLAIYCRELAKSMSIDNSLHFADYLYESQIEILDMLHEMQSKLQLDPQIAIDVLYYGKKMTSDMINQSTNLKKNVNVEEYHELIEQIDGLEMKTNHYRDTTQRFGNEYEMLYTLHMKKLAMEDLNFVPGNDAIDIISISALQSKLKNEASQFIDISINDSTLYMTSVNAKDLKIHKFNIPGVRQSIQIAKREILDKCYSSHCLSSIGNAMKNILENDSRTIYISTDLDLSTFPMEIITDEKGIEIFANHHIAYVGNMGQYMEAKINHLNGEKKIFAYDNSDSDHTPLPFALKEAKAIVNFCDHVNVIKDSKFNRSKIYKLENESLIHFASHSFSRQEVMLENYILTNKNEKVYGFELKNRNLKNKPIVVLSSCDSGVGITQPGAGTFSLSRDFISAGAQTVIKTLWPVNDVSGQLLISYFYNNLCSGMLAAEALKSAKDKLRGNSKFEHPYYWACFVLEGNGFVSL